ncbi:MAG: DUF1493 family protein [Alphaproteobacteria bacterium]|nr:DUF1493 family protein [Alphaproteobacteria bacterium]
MDFIAHDITKRVAGFLWRKRPVLPTAELYHDLHIAGDAASNLLEGIARDYDMAFAGFKFCDYFPDAPTALFHVIAARVGLRDRRRHSFTVAHLIDVVRQGAWFALPEAERVA